MAQPDEVVAMEALKASLAAARPGRRVSRSFRPMTRHNAADLERGVVALVVLGEGDFANYRGREADLGTLDVMLVALLKVLDSAEPVAIEDAEFVLLGQVKAWLRGALPVRQCLLRSVVQSGQQDAPYGWVTMKLEVMP